MKLAVAIMSFNRPDYFEQSFKSINQQTDKDVDFYLFQDGANKQILLEDVVLITVI